MIDSKKWMQRLWSDANVGYDQSPGDPVAAWAHSRILELEQTLRYIAGVDVPKDDYFRVAVESRAGMRAIALGVLETQSMEGDMSQISRFEKTGCEFCELDGFGAHAPRCPVPLEAELARLRALLNTPEVLSFMKGVQLEAIHQVERWGTADDRAKRPEDWFWLVGYLAGKALHAQKQSIDADARDLKQYSRGATDGAPHRDKALHHCISTAAALYNWHCAIKGVDVRMAPGSSDVAKIVDAAFPGEAPDWGTPG
jgi:hypothetical protein